MSEVVVPGAGLGGTLVTYGAIFTRSRMRRLRNSVSSMCSTAAKMVAQTSGAMIADAIVRWTRGQLTVPAH